MMSPDARRQMQDILQAALRTAVLPGATPEAPGGFRRVDPVDPDLADRFTRELTTLGGFVHSRPGADAATIAALIAEIGAVAGGTRLLAWDDQWLPVPGLGAALEHAGMSIDRQTTDDMPSAERRRALAEAVVGVTGADAALAETGSVVLASGAGRGRLASLLPPIHVALVDRSQIIRSLPELLLSRPDLATAGSNLVCITGPSRTADIEHTLSRGVHGPREVHVILI